MTFADFARLPLNEREAQDALAQALLHDMARAMKFLTSRLDCQAIADDITAFVKGPTGQRPIVEIGMHAANDLVSSLVAMDGLLGRYRELVGEVLAQETQP